jgi:hypothetical protein
MGVMHGQTDDEKGSVATAPKIKPRMVYVAGPISGYNLYEREATFNSAARLLRGEGYEVVNPFEVLRRVCTAHTWSEAMRTDITQMLTCDTIYLLRGWSKSKGASLELYIARALGFTVMEEPV